MMVMIMTNRDIPLVRFLAQAGFGSRRQCDKMIKERKVTVNGVIANLGTRIVIEEDQILVAGQPAKFITNFIYIMLNKPKGYLVSDQDPKNRRLANTLLPDLGPRLFSVGRLDFQTEGLILFTNDGIWANKIAHPRNQITKTYHAKVRNIPTESTLKKWRAGIKDNKELLKVKDISIIDTTKLNAWLKIVLSGGMNRQIRRMGTKTGHPVTKLKRVAIGNLELGSLKIRNYRHLTKHEIKQLIKK